MQSPPGQSCSPFEGLQPHGLLFDSCPCELLGSDHESPVRETLRRAAHGVDCTAPTRRCKLALCKVVQTAG